MSERMMTAVEFIEKVEASLSFDEMIRAARKTTIDATTEKAVKRMEADSIIAKAMAEVMAGEPITTRTTTLEARMPSITTRVDLGGVGLTMEPGGGTVFKVTPAAHKPVTWERGAYSIVRLNPNVDQYYVYNDQGLILTASDSFLEAEKFIQRQKTIDAQKAGLAPAKPEPPKTPENYGGW